MLREALEARDRELDRLPAPAVKAEALYAHLGTYRASHLRDTLDRLAAFFPVHGAVAQVVEAESVVRFLAKRQREEDALRQAACLDAAYPWLAACEDCPEYGWQLRGGDGHRCCSLCHTRYHARKARQLRDALGPQRWIGQLVITVPPELRAEHSFEHFTPNAARLGRYLEAEEWKACPAGAIYFHATGKSDPWKEHPQYNVIVGGYGMDRATGERRDIGGKWLTDAKREELKVRVSVEGLGIPADRAQGNWTYRSTPEKIAHCLRYNLRSQGDGNACARWHWTRPRARLLRPFGMLATGRRKHWLNVNPWGSEEERARQARWMESGLERCRACGGHALDLSFGH